MKNDTLSIYITLPLSIFNNKIDRLYNYKYNTKNSRTVNQFLPQALRIKGCDNASLALILYSGTFLSNPLIKSIASLEIEFGKDGVASSILLKVYCLLK